MSRTDADSSVLELFHLFVESNEDDIVENAERLHLLLLSSLTQTDIGAKNHTLNRLLDPEHQTQKPYMKSFQRALVRAGFWDASAIERGGLQAIDVLGWLFPAQVLATGLVNKNVQSLGQSCSYRIRKQFKLSSYVSGQSDSEIVERFLYQTRVKSWLISDPPSRNTDIVAQRKFEACLLGGALRPDFYLDLLRKEKSWVGQVLKGLRKDTHLFSPIVATSPSSRGYLKEALYIYENFEHLSLLASMTYANQ